MSDLHHAAAWGEDVLVSWLCLPGVGLPLSLSHASEEYQIVQILLSVADLSSCHNQRVSGSLQLAGHCCGER